MNNDPPLIITGMHRSGTSLVARFLHLSGIDLGPELLGPRPSNPYGHFEDVEFVAFHERVLLRQFNDSMWVPRTPELTPVDEARAQQLIADRREKLRWGWKDPRTCLFLDFWSSLLPSARYLFVVRHPLLVLDSLSRRTKSRPFHIGKHNTFLKAWLLYNHQCLRFHRQHQSVSLLITIEDALEARDDFVSALSGLAAFEFNAETFRASYDPGALRRKPSKRLLVFPWLRRKAVALYREMRKRG
jgi:hypothetical protein